VTVGTTVGTIARRLGAGVLSWRETEVIVTSTWNRLSARGGMNGEWSCVEEEKVAAGSSLYAVSTMIDQIGED
jgi:hypothetical protein